MEVTREGLARFFEVALPHLDERQRRVVAGAMSEMLGHGGKTAVATASGMSRNTVIKAQSEVEAGIEPSTRLREPGAGAKPLTEIQPGLLEALDELVNPETRGNPMSLLRWTSKSTAHLAKDLVRQGFRISDDTVGRLLKRLGYSLQAPAKQKEGTAHPDRDGQFRYLNDTAAGFVADGQPVISVDTKKKELVGEFSNKGVEYQPAGEPDRVSTHDFVDPELGRAIPYGIYDTVNDEGWVSVGTPRTPPSSRWSPSGGGGDRWARPGSPTPPACSSPPMPAGPTATGSERGRSSWQSSPPRPASPSR